jgi:hypothetical protein
MRFQPDLVRFGPAQRGRFTPVIVEPGRGTPGDYLTDKMPAVNTLLGGELAWRQHEGAHTNVANFPAFYERAGRCIASPGLTRKK